MDIEIGDIGLDIQQRGAIQHICAQDFQLVFLAIDQLYNGYTKWIGAIWIPGGENTMQPVIQEGLHFQLELSRRTV